MIWWILVVLLLIALITFIVSTIVIYTKRSVGRPSFKDLGSVRTH